MINKNNNDLIFIDFPDADNFLKVLYSIKKNKNDEIFVTGRPSNFLYAPFYPEKLKENIKKITDLIFTIDNKYNEENLKIKYPDFKDWFNMDKVNDEDTDVLFEVNIIRLNKFLISQGIENNTVKFFKSNKTHDIAMRHHFHKMEWAFDIDGNLKDEFCSILEDWKKDSIPISEKYGNKIRNILKEYIDINRIYKPEIHNIDKLKKEYDTFLIGGPFTDVENVLKQNIKVNKIIAMAGAIYTGTSNDKKANILPDQFNIYVDNKAFMFVIKQDIETILFPTESTKPWLKTNNGLTFNTSDILKWNKHIIDLIEKYNTNDLLEYYKYNKKDVFEKHDKEFALFDLVLPVYYYNDIEFNDEIKRKINYIYNAKAEIPEGENMCINKNVIIIEIKDNEDIINKKLIIDEFWKCDNKYIIVGNIKENDNRLLKFKEIFAKSVNECFI